MRRTFPHLPAAAFASWLIRRPHAARATDHLRPQALLVADGRATRVQDDLVFGEFGGVNPSITGSATYTLLRPEKMEELFKHDVGDDRACTRYELA